jgi:hypothetical protein
MEASLVGGDERSLDRKITLRRQAAATISEPPLRAG